MSIKSNHSPADCLEKRAVISPDQTPPAVKRPASLPGSKQAAGEPTVDELADDAATRLSKSAEELL